VRAEFISTQITDLRWLGLDWDYGPDNGGPTAPYFQSQRIPNYQAALQGLAALGKTYSCYCSRKEIAEAASAPHGPGDEGPRYPGTCAAGPPPVAPGVAQAIRFRTPPDRVVVLDEIQGSREFRPAEETGDFVVWRKDGVPAYQLAVVVDDAAMGITHVLRGSDLLASTARQILLYEALGLKPPHWAHVPLLLGPDGERLSKRHQALSLRELRERGVAPEKVVGWLAASCGLAGKHQEAMPQDLVSRYDPALLPREDATIDLPDWLRRSH
jgi:glutamyl-tRNA synthetase